MMTRNTSSSLSTYFVLAGIGLVVAALSGAALSWDGSVYLFQLLDEQKPFSPHYRFINVVLQAPILLLSQVTSDLTILRTAFGLVYTSTPLLALAASWWVVRRTAPTLFVWAAFGIGFGLLPGQFGFIAEALLAVMLFWPVGLAILLGMHREHVVLVSILLGLIVISHPVAAPLFVVGTGLCLVMGYRLPERRQALWRWALAFGALTVITGIRLWLFRTPYEIEQSSPDILLWSFTVAVLGLPMVSLASALVAALAVFAAPFVNPRSPLRYVLLAIEFLSLLAATALLIRWAIDPEQWRWALKYAYWAPIGSLAFLGFAILEVLIRPQLAGQHSRSNPGEAPEPAHVSSPVTAQESLLPHRMRTAQLVALSCSLVLIIQSSSWLHLTGRLTESMAQSPWSCVSMSRLGWLNTTALNSFATPAYSVLLQGRTPNKVVLSADACGTETFEQGVALHAFATRNLSSGWFNLQPLAEKLAADYTTPRNGCTFGLSTGWHQTETNDPFWWRWSDGRDAQIRVVVAEPTVVTLDGQIETARTPNQVAVLVNGSPVDTLPVTWEGLRPFGPLAVALQPGANTVQLVSQNAPVEIERRPLGIGVANVTATYGEGSTTCALHP
jgi:hypothetical protein